MLQSRVAELCAHLLPEKVNPTGHYSDAEYDGARGFIALVHAEIEAFLEDACRKVITESHSLWTNNKRANAVIFSVYAMCYTGWTEIPKVGSDLKKLSIENDVESRIGSAAKQYLQIVERNHGIKAANLEKLLVPIGIKYKKQCREDWLEAMTSFGGDRGKIVHLACKTITPPDPQGLRGTVINVLVPGLRELDIMLQEIVVMNAGTNGSSANRSNKRTIVCVSLCLIFVASALIFYFLYI